MKALLNSIRFRSIGMVVTFLAGSAAGYSQTFDNSKNSSLHGAYFIWELALSSFFNNGAFGQARSVYGSITFDGNGNYAFNGRLSDSSAGGGNQAYAANGQYAVSASGMAQLQPLIDRALVNADRRIYGAVSQGIFIGSSTEGALNDIVIAFPAGSGTSNGSVNGTYQVGALGFLQADFTLARDSYFTLNADGAGHFSSISVNGSAANLGSTNQTQTINGASYTMGGSGSGTASFPAAASGDATHQLFNGNKVLFVSKDGNFLLGGDPNGYDIFVGIRPTSSAADASIFSGIYFIAGLEEDGYSLPAFADIASFYGSAGAFGDGNVVYHQRENTVFYGVYDFTYNNFLDVASDGTASSRSFFYAFGFDGQVLLAVGQQDEYYLALAVAPFIPSTSGVFLNPLGVVNAASMAPITNPVAPNELVTLYGNNLASGNKSVSNGSLPTTLGGVKVMVNKRAAPISSVSPTQVNVLVPSATKEDYATFQVINNGVASNPVTVYASATSPGVFSSDTSGIGTGKVFHSDFTAVTDQKPAKVGETVIALVTGLGATTHPPADGAPGPASPLSRMTNDIVVLVDGFFANVSFAGLAPGLVGAYQVNFQVPQVPSSDRGDVYLDIATPTAYHTQVTFAVK